MNTHKYLLITVTCCGMLFCRVCACGITEKEGVYALGHVRADLKTAVSTLKPLEYDAYIPDDASAGLRPAVILMHGGSFRDGSRKHDALSACARYLAEHGFVCFSIDYRLMDDNPPAPYPWNATILQAGVHAACVDARAAIRFVRASAAEWNIAPHRIAFLGDSAGAFAALGTGIAPEDVFSSDGPEYPVPAENHPGVSGRPDVVIDLWGSAEHVRQYFDAGDPPILIIHGTKDTHIGVYFQMARNIRDACEKHGIPHRFIPLEGKHHGAWDGRYEGKPIPELALDFLREYLPPPRKTDQPG